MGSAAVVVGGGGGAPPGCSLGLDRRGTATGSCPETMHEAVTHGGAGWQGRARPPIPTTHTDGPLKTKVHPKLLQLHWQVPTVRKVRHSARGSHRSMWRDSQCHLALRQPSSRAQAARCSAQNRLEGRRRFPMTKGQASLHCLAMPELDVVTVRGMSCAHCLYAPRCPRRLSGCHLQQEAQNGGWASEGGKYSQGKRRVKPLLPHASSRTFSCVLIGVNMLISARAAHY